MSNLALSNDLAELCKQMNIQVDTSAPVSGGGSSSYTAYTMPDNIRKCYMPTKQERWTWLDPDGELEEEIEGLPNIREIGGVILGFEAKAELKTKYDPTAEPKSETLCQVVGYTANVDGEERLVKMLPNSPIKSMYAYSSDARGGKGGSDYLNPESAVEALGLIGAKNYGAVMKCSDCIRNGLSTTHELDAQGNLPEGATACNPTGMLYMVVTELTRYQKQKGVKGSDPTEVKISKNLLEEPVTNSMGEEVGPFLLAIKLPVSIIRGAYKEDIVGYYGYRQALSYLDNSDPCRDPKFNFTTLTKVPHPVAPSYLIHFSREAAPVETLKAAWTIDKAAFAPKDPANAPVIQLSDKTVERPSSSTDFFTADAEVVESEVVEEEVINPFAD